MPQIQELYIPLEEINGQNLDLSHLSPKRFRFINIHSFIRNKVLELVSLDDISVVKNAYATISYPWQSLELEASAIPPQLGQFTVKGAESGGFISSDVLMTSCRAAYHLVERGHKRPNLLWLDRLCIKQEDKDDKNWQIKNMYNIYKKCAICFVLPGGIKRLARLDERTTWAQRAWTLQEALVPPHVMCLFSWKKPGMSSSWQGGSVEIVEQFHSAALSLEFMLNAVMTGLNYTLQKPDNCEFGFRLETEKEDAGEEEVEVKDEDSEDDDDSDEDSDQDSDDEDSEDEDSDEEDSDQDSVEDSDDEDSGDEDSEDEEDPEEAFIDNDNSDWEDEMDDDEQAGEAKSYYKQPDEDKKYHERAHTFSNTEAHVLWNTFMAKSHNRERREAGLWKCALMRTSSRPVDMVFSVMGLFGVELDPASYKKNDREKATLDLVKKVLQNGGRATWLGLSVAIEPSPFMSTMPMFPKTEITGGAMIQTPKGPRSVQDLVDSSWMLVGAPTGTIDGDGYLHIRSRAAAIKRKEGSSTKERGIMEYEINGRAEGWVVQPGTSGLGAPYYAVVIGKRQPVSAPASGTYELSDPVLLMIIQRHTKNPDRYDRKSFAPATVEFVKNWPELFFRIGGPKGMRGH